MAGFDLYMLSSAWGEALPVSVMEAMAAGVPAVVTDVGDTGELVAGLGITVLTALHDLSLAALYCDSVYLLDAGRVVAHGPPAEVITVDTVRAAYGADVIVVPHPQTGAPQVLVHRAPSGAAVHPE